MFDDSDVDSEDEDVVSTKVIAAVQYDALMTFHFIYIGVDLIILM
jgi:hypothetical protein